MTNIDEMYQLLTQEELIRCLDEIDEYAAKGMLPTENNLTRTLANKLFEFINQSSPYSMVLDLNVRLIYKEAAMRWRLQVNRST